MCGNFESTGLRPIMILHMNVRGNVQPCKPVKISIPFSIGSFKRKEFVILQSDEGGDFKEVTELVMCHYLDGSVSLTVAHFTKWVDLCVHTDVVSIPFQAVTYLSFHFSLFIISSALSTFLILRLPIWLSSSENFKHFHIIASAHARAKQGNFFIQNFKVHSCYRNELPKVCYETT